jgi:hypothetical protein
MQQVPLFFPEFFVLLELQLQLEPGQLQGMLALGLEGLPLAVEGGGEAIYPLLHLCLLFPPVVAEAGGRAGLQGLQGLELCVDALFHVADAQQQVRGTRQSLQGLAEQAVAGLQALDLPEGVGQSLLEGDFKQHYRVSGAGGQFIKAMLDANKKVG